MQRPYFDSDRDSRGGTGGGMEDVSSLLKGEDITVRYGGKLRELSSCYDRDFAPGMELTPFILRLHRREDDEFMEKFQFMKETYLHILVGIEGENLFFPYLFLRS